MKFLTDYNDATLDPAVESQYDGNSFQKYQFDRTVKRLNGVSAHAGPLRDNTISGTFGEKVRKELVKLRSRECGMSKEVLS